MSRCKWIGVVVAALFATTGAGSFADNHGVPGDRESLVQPQLMAQGESCPGDVAPNGNVGFEDLIVVLSQWGPCPPPEQDCIADLDEDREVGLSDVLIVLSNWGPCPG